MEQDRWLVRTTGAAKQDFSKILLWTADQFGAAQAQVYLETLTQALEDLCAGPDIAGSKMRREIAPDLYTLHVGRKKRKGRHFLLFRVRRLDHQKVIEVIRILHDSMDLTRHLPPFQ